jgi:hypothetical protein
MKWRRVHPAALSLRRSRLALLGRPRGIAKVRAAGTLSKARSGQQKKRLPHYRKYRKFLCRGTSTRGVNCGELEDYDAGLS